MNFNLGKCGCASFRLRAVQKFRPRISTEGSYYSKCGPGTGSITWAPAGNADALNLCFHEISR